jgi:hypothetical protein
VNSTDSASAQQTGFGEYSRLSAIQFLAGSSVAIADGVVLGLVMEGDGNSGRDCRNAHENPDQLAVAWLRFGVL